MTGALTYSASVAPDEMMLVSAPSGTVPVGTAQPFAVRVMLGDGVTPVVGLPVTFSLSAGAAQFARVYRVAVRGADGCDRDWPRRTVTATAFGAVTVTAAAVGASETASFNAVAQSVAALQAVEYLAAGATVAWTPQVGVVENGAPAAGDERDVDGFGGDGGVAGGERGECDGRGADGGRGGAAGGGGAGHRAGVRVDHGVCGVCRRGGRSLGVAGGGGERSGADGDGPRGLRAGGGEGDGRQRRSGGGSGGIYISDGGCGGDGMPGAGAVSDCAGAGSSSAAAVSDANGLVSVTPMQVAGVGEVTNLAVATGTEGFAALSIDQMP